jgi:hypothetical protein
VAERAEFRTDITLSTDEVFDVLARCDEVVTSGEVEGDLASRRTRWAAWSWDRDREAGVLDD